MFHTCLSVHMGEEVPPSCSDWESTPSSHNGRGGTTTGTGWRYLFPLFRDETTPAPIQRWGYPCQEMEVHHGPEIWVSIQRLGTPPNPEMEYSLCLLLDWRGLAGVMPQAVRLLRFPAGGLSCYARQKFNFDLCA